MRVDNGICVGCGHCIPSCPQDAIEVMGTALIISKKCKECGVCIGYCPLSAIKENRK